MKGTTYDNLNNMMSDIQNPQTHFSNFDDHSPLLNYFINDKETCPPILHSPPIPRGPLLSQHHSNLNINQSHVDTNNDHPYSRIERDHCLISNNVPFVNNSSVHQQLGLRLDSNINNGHLSSSNSSSSHTYLHPSIIHNLTSSSIYSTNIMSQKEHINSSLSGFVTPLTDNNSNSSFKNHSINITHMAEISPSLPNSVKTEQNWMPMQTNLTFSNFEKNQESFENVCKINDKNHIQLQPNLDNNLNQDEIADVTLSDQTMQTLIEPANEPFVKSTQPSIKSIFQQIQKPDNTNEKDINANLNELAELRTVIIFKIVDQIVHQGKVLKETILKDEEYTKICKTIPIHEALKQDLSSFKASFSQSNIESFRASKNIESISSPLLTSSQEQPLKPLNTDNKLITSKKLSKSINKIENHSNKDTIIENHSNKLSNSETHSVIQNDLSQVNLLSLKRKATFGGSVKKGKLKLGEEIEAEFEKARQETATALLSLHENKVKPIDSILDFEFKSEPIAENRRVFAKWNDKIFYPGIVSLFQSDNKWLISFYDGAKKVVHESEIISVPFLCNGQPVMISLSNDYCAKGVIKRHFFEGAQLFYDVEYEELGQKKIKQCSPDDIFLTPELASILLGKQNKSLLNASEFAGLDLNNIIPKRSRGNKNLITDSASNENFTFEPDTVSTKVIKPKKSNSASKCTKTEIIFTNAVLPDSKKKKTFCKNKPLLAPIAETEIVNNICKPFSSISKSLPCAEREKLLGPLPPSDSTLFKGIGFLLTAPNNIIDGEKAASEAGRSTPFDILYLINQIEMGSGVVFDNLETARSSTEIYDLVLIAYTYQKTVLYLQCLAAGIPCIMHTWIIESCRCNQLLKRDSYLLPSGYSIINRNLPTDKNVFKKSANLFKGMKFMLSSKELLEIWTPVLTAANATIITQIPSSLNSNSSRKTSNFLDVIIADSSCPETVIKRAEQLKIPIVSSEYIVQCLINGRKLPFDAHDKFNYNIK